MPTMESHLKISQLFPEMNKTEISLHLLRGSLISAWLLWTHHCQACAFYSLDLFMTGRGISYYGACVCTAPCLPVTQARGCLQGSHCSRPEMLMETETQAHPGQNSTEYSLTGKGPQTQCFFPGQKEKYSCMSSLARTNL